VASIIDNERRPVDSALHAAADGKIKAARYAIAKPLLRNGLSRAAGRLACRSRKKGNALQATLRHRPCFHRLTDRTPHQRVPVRAMIARRALPTTVGPSRLALKRDRLAGLRPRPASAASTGYFDRRSVRR